jgi:succinoglycan biosynthesis transport protein ExoP
MANGWRAAKSNAEGIQLMNDSNAVEQFLSVARRRWRIVLLCVLAAGGCAVALSLLQQNLYTASSSVLFRNDGFDQQILGNLAPSTPQTDPTREAATDIELVSLATVASRTAAALHLPGSYVGSEVAVSGVGQANVAQVNVTDPDPIRAAQIANTYAQQFVLFRQQADRAKIAGAQKLVETELAALPATQRYASVGQSLQNRADQLGVVAALQTGNAEVVQPAGVPTSPSAPNTKKNGVLGALLGLLLGMGLAFVSERLNPRIRDRSELEDAYGVPVLGTVPSSPVFTAAGGVAALPPAEAASFALLRAHLRYFNVGHDKQSSSLFDGVEGVLLVTSALADEGKTTVALNLAIAEAAASDAKIVLVEADFHNPTLAKRLGIDSLPGLSEILSCNSTLEAAVHPVNVPRPGGRNGATAAFAVITAGATPPNPAELLERRTMVDLLTALSERFDLTIIDTPPPTLVPDAIPLMRHVAGVLVVSRMDVVTRSAARDLRQQLGKLKAPVLGVVANAVSARAETYYDYSDEAKYEAKSWRRSYARPAPVSGRVEPDQSERLAAATAAAPAGEERATPRREHEIENLPWGAIGERVS